MTSTAARRRSLWPAPEGGAVLVIDQRLLPHQLVVARLDSVATVRTAIVDMWVRGAPLIGAAAAYGIALQCRVAADDDALRATQAWLDSARPTAVNLAWATQRMVQALRPLPVAARAAAAWQLAGALADEDVATNAAIGRHGLGLLQALAAQHPGRPLNVLTHCNAGALATAGYGTALGVFRAAREQGKKFKIFVDETRPLLQGARLTAWELYHEGFDATLICDNMAGSLIRDDRVQGIVVGADRITSKGFVANKIGTYPLAVLAKYNGVPFYVAAPASTFDLSIAYGNEIKIEERDHNEVRFIGGVQVAPDDMPVYNPAFDVTPPELITAIITDRGLIRPIYGETIPEIIGKKQVATR